MDNKDCRAKAKACIKRCTPVSELRRAETWTESQDYTRYGSGASLA